MGIRISIVHANVICPHVNAMYIHYHDWIEGVYELRTLSRFILLFQARTQHESIAQGLQTMGKDCLLDSPRRYDLPSHWLQVNEDWALKLS